MYKLEEFKQLVKDFSDVSDFLVVYIAEAHSTGELKSGEGIIITKSLSGVKRKRVAKICFIL